METHTVAASINENIVVDLVDQITELGKVQDHVPTQTDNVTGLIKLEDQTLIDPDQLTVLHRLGIAPTVYEHDNVFYADPDEVVKVVRYLVTEQLKFAMQALGYAHVKNVLVSAVQTNTITEEELPEYLEAVQSTLAEITSVSKENV